MSIEFLRQIPYMSEWSNKDVDKIFNFCKESKAENLNQIIVHEGTKCNKVYVILEGEVEIVKTNLSNVFFNAEAGVLGINEENAKGRSIRSSVLRDEEDSLDNFVIGGVYRGQYKGTDF